MTLSVTSAHNADSQPAPGNSWTRLTEADATRIAAAIAATHAETPAPYMPAPGTAGHVGAPGRGLVPLPAEPVAVCAYLTERADQGVSLSAIDQTCSAIGHQHRHHGLPDPIDHDAVRQVRRGLRRSELAGLTLADIEVEPAGLLLQLRRSRTDPEGRGQIVGVAHGQHPLTDPVAALHAWLAFRGVASGPLFTSMRPGLTTMQPISGNAVIRIVKDRAAAAGLSTERITPHSLRAGHATTAARAGVAIDRIAAQTRHRRIDVLIERYIRPAQALATTSSRDLGL